MGVEAVVFSKGLTFTFNQLGMLFIRKLVPNIVRNEEYILASYADKLFSAVDLPGYTVLFAVIEVNGRVPRLLDCTFTTPFFLL